MTAFVRVCGPPNGAYLVGYPGISATLVSRVDAGAGSLSAPRGVEGLLTLRTYSPG